MEQNLQIPTKKFHIVAMPYPGRGHINPMLNLCKILLSKSHNIFITFVVTQEWLGFLGSELKPLPANFRLAALPQVIPSEVGRAANMRKFIEAVLTKLEDPFERLVDRLELKPKAIIYDVFLSWVVKVGNQRNIPVAALVTVSASFFTIFSHFDLLVKHGHVPLHDASDETEDFILERNNDVLDYIPGLPSITFADLPPSFQKDGKQLLNQMLDMVPATKNAQHLLIASIYEFEEQAINALKLIFPSPLYTIGPLIPYISLKTYEDTQNTQQYFQWLDAQPKGSVLYISQGSHLSVSDDQFQEIVAGVVMSNVRFLWVTRGETWRFKCDVNDDNSKDSVCSRTNWVRFKDGISDNGMGYFVPWCDQLRVLCHPSIGGFWTHCGWNSSLEGFYAGVPMLTCPLSWDQFLHSNMVVEDLKIGWGVIETHPLKSREIFKRSQIVHMLKKFMDPSSGDRNDMVRRAKELGDTFRKATLKGGSSACSIDAFINNILEHNS